MKKTYEAPLFEKIEFDYSDTVTASFDTYMVSNEWYDCHSSLKPDSTCGYNQSGGVHTDNATHDCTKQ